jgi:hypothetical protein
MELLGMILTFSMATLSWQVSVTIKNGEGGSLTGTESGGCKEEAIYRAISKALGFKLGSRSCEETGPALVDFAKELVSKLAPSGPPI